MILLLADCKNSMHGKPRGL